MEVTRRYAGGSGVAHGQDASTVSFAPDLTRDPAFFVGAVSNHVAFREAISTLHHVVVSDLRFKPKDRTEYMAWLETQKDEMLAEAAAEGRAVNERLGALREEMRVLDRRASTLLQPYRQAEKKYFDWLYRVNKAAWFVLDPVIAVHPDEVSFECFSSDESTYGRLSCDLEMFDEVDEVAHGVTNIDYSHALYDAFQQIRSYRRTELRVEPGGFTASNEAGREIFEEKIDLPETWVRGFLQVSSAMTLPAARVTLHPMDVHNICFALRRRKEREGPRSLRIVLRPGEPVEIVVEPWNERIPCPRAVYHGTEEAEIRLWGRRRLLILERLIPIARSFDLHLLGTGLPAFAVADLGPMTFTLGLSGWTANDWSRAGQFDLLAPRRRTDSQTRARVLEAISGRWLGTTAEIAAQTGLDRAEVASALTILAQHGRTMYDLDKDLWRFRDMMRTPLDMDTLRFASDREAAADRLLTGGFVTIRDRAANAVRGRVTDDGRDHAVAIALDDDDRLVGAECGCAFHRHNALRKGPCAHILALRRAAGEGAGGPSVLAGPWGRK